MFPAAAAAARRLDERAAEQQVLEDGTSYRRELQVRPAPVYGIPFSGQVLLILLTLASLERGCGTLENQQRTGASESEEGRWKMESLGKKNESRAATQLDGTEIRATTATTDRLVAVSGRETR